MVISTIFDGMRMKNFRYFIITGAIVLCAASSFGQNVSDSILPKKPDTNKVSVEKKAPVVVKKNILSDTVKVLKRHKAIPVADTTKRENNIDTSAQNITVQNRLVNDSINRNNKIDTVAIAAVTPLDPTHFAINKILLNNRFINVKDASVFFIEEARHPSGKEFLFYSLCFVVLILGIFKTFYSNYFKNLFRVFFNTSLRQTQLADQLLQAKLPSFILNIFFTITTGIYIWLLFNHYHPPRLISSKLLLPFCILSVALLYFIKFCLLKFMGWVSDIQQTTDNYIFAIFLVNKIAGILLVPIIILLAFLKTEWLSVITDLSFMILGLFFLSRYIKSYGAIEKKMPLNPFHFIIYIAGAEIIPLIIIYKVAIDYLI